MTLLTLRPILFLAVISGERQPAPGSQSRRVDYRSHQVQLLRSSRMVLLLCLHASLICAQTQTSPTTGRLRLPAERAPDGTRLSAEAHEALRKGDYAKAISSYEALVQRLPNVAEFHANLGLAYYSAERYPEAVRSYERALKLKPALLNTRHFLGLSLAASGRCQDAFGYLERGYSHIQDTSLRHLVGINGLRCAMTLNQADKAVDFVRWLNRDFPNDPEVLYLSSHVYSDLATNASQRLLLTAPGSVQAHRLNAEVLTLQGKLDDAVAEYRKVLSMEPRLPGIHYRIERLLLAGTRTDAALAQARREFEEELRIDPRSAPAEYELGEMARQARQWEEAIRHFRRATQLEPTFAQALTGLGKSLVSAGKPQEAILPLQRAVQLEPDNSVAHYQLSFAYRRVGLQREAERELAAYRLAHEKAQQVRDFIRAGLIGPIVQEQTAEPPE